MMGSPEDHPLLQVRHASFFHAVGDVAVTYLIQKGNSIFQPRETLILQVWNIIRPTHESQFPEELGRGAVIERTVIEKSHEALNDLQGKVL